MTGYLWRGQPALARLNAAIMAGGGPAPCVPGQIQHFDWPAARRGDPEHGSERAYRAHLRSKQAPCDACRAGRRDRKAKARAAA